MCLSVHACVCVSVHACMRVCVVCVCLIDSSIRHIHKCLIPFMRLVPPEEAEKMLQSFFSELALHIEDTCVLFYTLCT